jgi:septal ring factor EnvC (AmiA/AmiB activator)
MVMVAVFLSVLLVIWVWLLAAQLKQQQRALVKLHSEQQSTLATLNAVETAHKSIKLSLYPLQDNAQVALDKIAELESLIVNVRLEQDELIAQDPQVKLYQKAAKMIREGASLEELMEACDLPRAEAELMFSMQEGVQGQVSEQATETNQQ